MKIIENMKNTLQFTMYRGEKDGMRKAKRFKGGGRHEHCLTCSVLQRDPTLHVLIQHALHQSVHSVMLFNKNRISFSWLAHPYMWQQEESKY